MGIVWQGVIVYFRVTDGCMKPGDTVRLMNTKVEHDVLDMGVLAPKPVIVSPLGFRIQHFQACHGEPFRV